MVQTAYRRRGGSRQSAGGSMPSPSAPWGAPSEHLPGGRWRPPRQPARAGSHGGPREASAHEHGSAIVEHSRAVRIEAGGERSGVDPTLTAGRQQAGKGERTA